MKDISMRFLNENTLEKLAYDAWLDMREARTEEERKESKAEYKSLLELEREVRERHD